ncbi:MAG: Ig-like domain-containing protein, partial [Clostridia bacterium]|nr:Ig-like domain-containing protein [Clostridia bacterium]
MMKNLMRLISLALCLALTLAIAPAALASGVTPVYVDSVIIPSTMNLRIGGSDTLNAMVSPQNATNTGVTYHSSDPSRVTVDMYGTVRAVAAGSAVITATAADRGIVTASCQVSVWEDTKITLNKTNISLKVGATEYLTATVTPNQVYNQGLSYSSGNINVCSVSNNGMITGTGAGTTQVYVTAADGTRASCTVAVGAPVTQIQLDYSSVSVSTGRTLTIGATVLPTNATNKGLTWKSSDENVATVDNFGNVRTWRSGTTFITVTAADGSGISTTCQVSVSGTEVTKVPT